MKFSEMMERAGESESSPLVLGKKYLVSSSNGGTQVGTFTGLSNLGTKCFVVFSTTSGVEAVNVSYLETIRELKEEC